jgi:hypothetical protein
VFVHRSHVSSLTLRRTDSTVRLNTTFCLQSWTKQSSMFYKCNFHFKHFLLRVFEINLLCTYTIKISPRT